MTHRRRIAVVAVAASLIATGVSASDIAGAAPAAPTCQGERATLVGSPAQRTVKGTRGDDVVITNGSTRVITLSGDDLICVVGNDAVKTLVRAGRGDDSVVVTGSGAGTYHLNQGADRFTGGSGPELVVTDADVTDERDVVATGGGADVVRTGVWQAPSNDRIALGPGNDVLELVMPRQGEGAQPFRGGPGQDRIVMGAARYQAPGAWTVDNRAGTAQVDGDAALSWADFESLDARPQRGPATFSGTGRAETFWVRAGDTVTPSGGADICRDGTVDSRGLPAGDVVPCPT
ncbi:hypothetical protein [Nocardioides sp. R-C-SC26]|uniref:hypothetical protein n=1 Tax=Nocardioides sp. R-C-SC26 TaxID=2870414 RepID=UPI001E39FDF0|nr:hypothetical protein [Nocardioides sp. R-C-SC26]